MKRHFRIDASKKIQASPVDFDRFAGRSKTDKEQIASILSEHRDNLIDYFDIKVGGVVKQLNADIDKIKSTYITSADYMEQFLNILCGELIGIWDTSENSMVLQNLKYEVESDSSYIFSQIKYDSSVIDADDHGDDLFYGPSTACVCFLDFDDINDALEHLDICQCNSDGFVDSLSLALTLKPYIQQVTLGTVVDVAEKIIYEFAEFVDEQFSRIFESAIEQFLEE